MYMVITHQTGCLQGTYIPTIRLREKRELITGVTQKAGSVSLALYPQDSARQLAGIYTIPGDRSACTTTSYTVPT